LPSKTAETQWYIPTCRIDLLTESSNYSGLEAFLQSRNIASGAFRLLGLVDCGTSVLPAAGALLQRHYHHHQILQQGLFCTLPSVAINCVDEQSRRLPGDREADAGINYRAARQATTLLPSRNHSGATYSGRRARFQSQTGSQDAKGTDRCGIWSNHSSQRSRQEVETSEPQKTTVMPRRNPDEATE
jgi:hypothetical protein